MEDNLTQLRAELEEIKQEHTLAMFKDQIEETIDHKLSGIFKMLKEMKKTQDNILDLTNRTFDVSQVGYLNSWETTRHLGTQRWISNDAKTEENLKKKHGSKYQ